MIALAEGDVVRRRTTLALEVPADTGMPFSRSTSPSSRAAKASAASDGVAMEMPRASVISRSQDG
jgi:hypothetical protein